MITRSRFSLSFLVLTLLFLTGCIDGGHDDSPGTTDPEPPVPPSVNPFLADSIAPIAHHNSAQTDSVDIAGPAGPTERLDEAGGGLSYQHLGPAHFGLAISPQYPDSSRVIWSNGGDRISKLDYETLAVIDELLLPVAGDPAWAPLSAAAADQEIATMDSLLGLDLANQGLALGGKYFGEGLSGVYYLLSADNVLYVGGSDSLLAYADITAGVQKSKIKLRDEWQKPAGIGGNFVTANITYDGWICTVTDEGWVVLVKPDFSEYHAIQMLGSEIAPAHNQKMIDEGNRPGSASWVRNGPAIDEDGGIYIPSLEHMHKVVWDGTRLSTDPADGAWVAQYNNGTGIGTGATASLMGYDGEDQFVVITDGDEVMNMLLFWRNEIPADWQQLDGTLDRRIAGQVRADIGNDSADAVQTEQSVVVGGYGAFVVNNAPASFPSPLFERFPSLLAGFAGRDPAITPHGIQKFEWDPVAQELREAWVNTEISSANSVPVISTASNLIYTVGARNNEWTLEAIDWDTGASAFHYVTGSYRYNTLFSGLFLDEEGRVIHTTAYGILRYERFPTE